MDDARGLAAELRQQRALLNESLLELIALIDRRVGEAIEELDGDRLVPDRVLGAIDDREASFADHALDAVLFGDRGADEVQGSRSAMGVLRTDEAFWRAVSNFQHESWPSTSITDEQGSPDL